jgi:DNA-binding MarR family transcriptional regulator
MEAHAERELDVLEHIAELGDVRQRDLARIVGVSLGMVNAILRRLSKKGLLTVHKINNRNIAYAVTPEGMEAIAKRSYRYLRRTIKNVVDYRDTIEAIVRAAKHDGFGRLVLVGESDLAFIVEHFCWKWSLPYATSAASEDTESGDFLLYAESRLPPPGASSGREASLRAVLGFPAEPSSP